MSERWTPGHDGVPRPAPPLEGMTPAQLERVATPDGVPLAPWWRRLLSYGIDAALVTLVVQLALLPWRLGDPTLAGLSTAPRLELDVWLAVGTPAWWLGVLSILGWLVVSAAGSIAMLTRLGWTPGKRALGIRVRHRDHERLPTVAEAARRWAVQLAPAAFVGAGPVGLAANAWLTIDGLRPLLWDDRRQAFHDSAAGTSVVLA